MQNDDDFEPQVLGLDAAPGPARSTPKPPRRVQGRFLRGPVPWDWIAAAGRLPGRALHVGLVLWFKAGCANAMTLPISLTAVAKELDFDRSSASRGLAALARVGLVSVKHMAGRKVEVTIIGAPMRADTADPATPSTQV